MTPLEYDFLRKSLRERSGLMLSADKQYLVESRLLPIARKAGLATLGELVAVLRRGDSECLMTMVVEAMTTNETFFFRDKVPFENLRTAVLPALLAARRPTRRIRIWSAAASSGQEPYSLAMTIKELEDTLAGWRIEIVATDLAGGVLEKAQAGIYSQFEIQRGLPIQLLIKYFSKVGDMWQIAPELRAMVKFKQLNLLSDFSSLGTFDLIFCRNVLIYFDQDTKTSVLNRCPRHRRRRLSHSRRCRNGGGIDRQFSHRGGTARALCTEHPPAAAAGRRRGQAGPAPGCGQRGTLIQPTSACEPEIHAANKNPGPRPGFCLSGF